MPEKTKPYRSTLAFRRFNEKNTSLNRIYWTGELGRELIRRGPNGVNNDAQAIAVLGVNIEQKKLPETAGELTAVLDERAGVERLHLLIVCAANLESYLQEITKLHVAAIGHCNAPNSLSDVGKALARPVVNSSTLPDMIGYLESLLAISFDIHRQRWFRGFRLRCSAAHEGGVVTGSTLQKMPDIGLVLGSKIVLSWIDLKDYLHSAHEIAVRIDKRVSNGPVRILEAEWLLYEWQKAKILPPKKEVWTKVHALGVPKIPRNVQQRLEAALYQK